MTKTNARDQMILPRILTTTGINITPITKYQTLRLCNTKDVAVAHEKHTGRTKHLKPRGSK